MDLTPLLSQRMSRANADRVIDAISNKPQLFPALLAHVLKDDPSTSLAAMAWGDLVLYYPERYYYAQPALLAAARQSVVAAVPRAILRYFSLQPVGILP
ncbi:MAG: hypothetical protein HC821_05860, partial [Lewinella sp.]|nr:hypothetical protein [Lewinella sp.]